VFIDFIRKDSFGLYVISDGYICRPLFKTRFKVGDNVKIHHFGNGLSIGVGYPKTAHFNNDKTFEYWFSIGTGPWEKGHPDRWVINGRTYKSWNTYMLACSKNLSRITKKAKNV
jgi:hypothetical protein